MVLEETKTGMVVLAKAIANLTDRPTLSTYAPFLLHRNFARVYTHSRSIRLRVFVVNGAHTRFVTSLQRIILWLVDPLLGNGSANAFLWIWLLGKQPVMERRFRGYETERLFLCRSVPTLYIRKPRYLVIWTRTEYIHRDPASRRRRQKGKSQIWDSKIWSRVPRDWTQERLRWRGAAAYRKDTPVHSSERAPLKNMIVTVKE
jgi:hypothetical protein